MALPRIDPYPLPTSAELPTAKVGWIPEPHRVVLLVHDMQRYFLRPFVTTGELLGNVARVRQWCRNAGVPVVYTAQPPRPSTAERGLLRDFWGDGLAATVDDDPGLADIVEELTPSLDETTLMKWRYSAFVRTPFADVFARTGRDQLLITGVYAHIGCLATTLDAFMRDIQPFLIVDAVADFSRRHHDDTVTYVTQRCGVVLPTAAVGERLGQAARAAR